MIVEADTLGNRGNMRFSIKAILLILSGVSFIACDRITGCEDKELARQKSPDSKVDYVIFERDCGATTSKVNKIFITPSGQKVKGEPIFVSDKSERISVSWLAPKLLAIEYQEARIYTFQNFWSSKEVENFNYEIRINERQKQRL